MWRNFEVSANFFVKTVTGSMLYQPVSQWHSLHFELMIELVAQKLTELWRFKIWPIFWPGDLVPWPTYLSMSHTGTAHPFHMWTKFGDDMSKRSWVMLDKTDRLSNRQTDRQTNRQTNILAKNCKFWQVIIPPSLTDFKLEGPTIFTSNYSESRQLWFWQQGFEFVVFSRVGIHSTAIYR